MAPLRGPQKLMGSRRHPATCIRIFGQIPRLASHDYIRYFIQKSRLQPQSR